MMHDVQFINNVRVVHFFRIINVCGDSSRSIVMMTACCDDF